VTDSFHVYQQKLSVAAGREMGTRRTGKYGRNRLTSHQMLLIGLADEDMAQLDDLQSPHDCGTIQPSVIFNSESRGPMFILLSFGLRMRTPMAGLSDDVRCSGRSEVPLQGRGPFLDPKPSSAVWPTVP
jgi:hypothetical protein